MVNQPLLVTLFKLVNLATSLVRQGLNVGILDCDVFGPSIPTMLNLDQEPMLVNNKLQPLSNYGLQAMSIGFLIPPDKPVTWRGLMVMKAIQQLLWDVEWRNLDILVIDLPPGTGDVQLTIAQQVVIDGAVIVSTPQDISLIDAVRGIKMFETVKIPVLGLVQNMSLFACPNCNHVSHIFGSDGAIRKAKEMGIKVLASIPLDASVCEDSDRGRPAVLNNTLIADIYKELALTITETLNSKERQ